MQRFFLGFSAATIGLGLALLVICAVALGLTVAGLADLRPPFDVWQAAVALVVAGLLLRWLLGQVPKGEQPGDKETL